MVYAKEWGVRLCLDAPAREVRLISLWDLPRGREPHDTKERHVGVLIVGYELCSTEALLLGGTYITLSLWGLEVKEEDGRSSFLLNLGEVSF